MKLFHYNTYIGYIIEKRFSVSMGQAETVT